MKKLHFVLLGLFLFASSGVSAQAYVWDKYGVGFRVADDFEVVANNNQLFEAYSSDDELWIAIQPWIDASITEDDLLDGVLQIADNVDFWDGGDYSGDYIEIDDYNGYFIVVAPNSRLDYDYVIIALLLDIDSSTNLIVTIGYMDGNFAEARDMLLSFYAY